MENATFVVPTENIVDSENLVEIGTQDDTKTTDGPSEDREMEEEKSKEEKQIVDQWISNLNQWNYTPQSNELRQGYRILKELMAEGNKSVNWPFMDAVDIEATGLFDYYERVKKPMWLRKMKSKYELEEFESITEFVSDFRLMLENCYRYNGPDHYVSKRGQRLETMMEQKLTLLSRELRAKTTIEATSGSFSTDGRISPYGGSSRRRGKNIVPHDSTALLNQLRLEEAQKEREARKCQIQERRAAQEAYAQGVQDWEDKLLAEPIKTQLQHMWEFPQIGLFLFLCQGPLNIGEVVQFELERCFAMVRESTTLQAVMTTLLSTPYQRTRLDKKPMMPYKVWEEKLRTKIRLWYKALQDSSSDPLKAATKIGIDPYFFTVLGKKNPLEKKKFHELSFYRKVWIVKSLCDHCLETQESIRDAVESQPIEEQREYFLGKDAEGNTYLHFPQFCGADLRIYRQGPIPHPVMDKVIVMKETPVAKRKKYEEVKTRRKKKKTHKKKEKRVIPTPPPSNRPSRPSRLRQNIKPVLQLVLSESSESSDSSSSSEEEGDETEESTLGMDDSSTCSSNLTNSSIRTRTTTRTVKSSISSKDSTPEPPSFRGKIRKPRFPRGISSNRTRLDCDKIDRGYASAMNGDSQFEKNKEPSEDSIADGDDSRDCGENDFGETGSMNTSARSHEPSPMEVDGDSTCSSVVESSHKTSGKITNQSFAGDVNSNSNGSCDNMACYSDSNSCGPLTDKVVCNGKLAFEVTDSDGACNDSAISENKASICAMSPILDQADSPSGTRVKCERTDSFVKVEPVKDSAHNQGTGVENKPVIQSSGYENIHAQMENKHEQTFSADNVILSNEPLVMPVSAVKTEVGELFTETNDRNTCSLSLLANMALANICTESEDTKSGLARRMSEMTEATQAKPVQSHKSGRNLLYSDSADVKSEMGVHGIKDKPGGTAISAETILKSEHYEAYAESEECTIRIKAEPIETEPLEAKSDNQPCETNLSSVLQDKTVIRDENTDTVTMVTEVKVDHDMKVEPADPEECVEQSNGENMDNANASINCEGAGIKLEREASGGLIKTETGVGEDSLVDGFNEGVTGDELDDNTTERKDTLSELENMKKGHENSDKGENSRTDGGVGKQSGEQCVTIDTKTESDLKTAVEEESEEEEEVTPEIGPFELIADNVDNLRLLVEQFAEPQVEVTMTPRSKKQKMSRPPTRKRCVVELYDRLLFLLKELEPWDSKLSQATKKARLKLRKEQDDYVDEEEEKKNIEDVWDSEESVTSSEESSSDEEETTTVDPKSQPLPRPKSNKKPALEIDAASTGTNTPDEDEMNVSSRGRVLKRRVIPNNVEDTGPKKRKVVKSLEETFSSVGHVPNILQKHHTAKADPSSIFVKTLPISLLDHLRSPSATDNSNRQGTIPMSASQMLLKANLSAKQAQGIPLSSLLSIKDLANVTVLTRSPNKSSEFGAVKGSSHPVIQQLLTKKAPVLIAQTNKLPLQQLQGKPIVHPSTTSVMLQSKTVAGTIPASSCASTVQKPGNSSYTMTVAGNKTRKIEIAKPRQTAVRLTYPSPRKNTPGKVQLYNHNILSSLPPEVIQQLLKTQALRIQTVSSGGSPKGATGGTIILSSPTKPSTATITTAGLATTQAAVETMGPPTPVKINIPAPNLLTSPVPQDESSAAMEYVVNNLNKPKYACHVTVKSLLKDKAKKALKSRTDESDKLETEESSNDTNIIPSAAQVLSLASEVGQQLPTALSASQIQQPIVVTVNTAIKGMPQTLKLPSKETLDSAVQAVVTSVKTTLPTAHLKVPAPSTLPSIQPRKNVTKTVQSMKSPVISTSTGRNTYSASSTAIPFTVQTGAQASLALQSKSGMSAMPAMHQAPITTLTASSGVGPKINIQTPNSGSAFLSTIPLIHQTPVPTLTSSSGPATKCNVLNPFSSLRSTVSSAAGIPNLVRTTNGQLQATSPATQQNNMLLKMVPQTFLTSQGLVQGFLTPQGLVIPQSSLQHNTVQPSKQGLVVSQASTTLQQQSQLAVSTSNLQQRSQPGVSTVNLQQLGQLGASLSYRQQPGQSGVSATNLQQLGQLTVSTTMPQQLGQLGISTTSLHHQQHPQLGVSLSNPQQQIQLDVSPSKLQQTQLGVSPSQLQQSQLGVSATNLQQHGQLGATFGTTVAAYSPSAGFSVMTPQGLRIVTSGPGQLPGKIVKPYKFVASPYTELAKQTHKPTPNVQITAGTSPLLSFDAGAGQLKQGASREQVKQASPVQNIPTNSATSPSKLLLQAANSALQRDLIGRSPVGNSLKPPVNSSKKNHPVLTESLMKGLNIKIESSCEVFKKDSVVKMDKNTMQSPIHIQHPVVNQKGDGAQPVVPSPVDNILRNMAYGAGDTAMQQNISSNTEISTSLKSVPGNLVTHHSKLNATGMPRTPNKQENLEQSLHNASGISRTQIKQGKSEQTLAENSGLPAAQVLLSLSQRLAEPGPATVNVADKVAKTASSRGEPITLPTIKAATEVVGSTNVANLNLQALAQSQLSPQTEAPQKLLLFNIGGQLFTSQGIPVTLDNGVLKIAGPTTSQVTQPQSTAALSTTPPIVSPLQSQIVKQFTPPKPFAQHLQTVPIQLAQNVTSAVSVQSNVLAVKSESQLSMRPAIPQGLPPSGVTTVLNQSSAVQKATPVLVPPVSTVMVHSATQSKPLVSPTQPNHGGKKGKMTVKQLITSPTRKIQPQPVAAPQSTVLAIPGGQAMQLMSLNMQQPVVQQNKPQMMVPGLLLADPNVQGKVHVAQQASPLLNQLTLRPMVQNVMSPVMTLQGAGVPQSPNKLQHCYSGVMPLPVSQPAGTIISTSPVVQQSSGLQLGSNLVAPTSVPQSPVLLQMVASSPRHLLTPNSTQLSTQKTGAKPTSSTVLTTIPGGLLKTTNQSQ